MRPNPKSSLRAFTLIELILVMMLLVIVLSLVVPSLMKFFGGRTLDSEVRQLVALTHYGQSRAVSEGVPMVLWVDPRKGQYGLRQEAGYTDKDTKDQQYTVGDGLTLGVDVGNAKTLPGKQTGIHFSPDGNIITASSIKGVSVQQGKNRPVWIRPTADGLSYELRP